jgi:hypothetical protein
MLHVRQRCPARLYVAGMYGTFAKDKGKKTSKCARSEEAVHPQHIKFHEHSVANEADSTESGGVKSYGTRKETLVRDLRSPPYSSAQRSECHVPNKVFLGCMSET